MLHRFRFDSVQGERLQHHCIQATTLALAVQPLRVLEAAARFPVEKALPGESAMLVLEGAFWIMFLQQRQAHRKSSRLRATRSLATSSICSSFPFYWICAGRCLSVQDGGIPT